MQANSFKDLFEGRRSELADALDVSDGSRLWVELRAKNVLSKTQVDDCTTLRTTYQRFTKLLELLELRPASLVPGFIEVLQKSDQPKALDVLMAPPQQNHPMSGVISGAPMYSVGTGNLPVGYQGQVPQAGYNFPNSAGGPQYGYPTASMQTGYNYPNTAAGTSSTGYYNTAPSQFYITNDQRSGFVTASQQPYHSAGYPIQPQGNTVPLQGYNAPFNGAPSFSVPLQSPHYSVAPPQVPPGAAMSGTVSAPLQSAAQQGQTDAGPSVKINTLPFGHLQAVEAIAEGGFGRVYRAILPNIGIVAYKELKITVEPPAKISKELKGEAMTFNLRHPNVIMLIGIVYEPGHYGVIFEFARFRGLDDFIDNYEVEWPMKLSFAHGIAVGMTYLHARNPPVVHGDLKRQNVLIADGFIPKIADFGLTKWTTFSTRRTNSQTRRGTVTNIPPEYWTDINMERSKPYDIYGYGVLLWELMAEQWAFQNAVGGGDQTKVIKQAVIDGERPNIEEVTGPPEEVLRVIRPCIQRCWGQDPNKRPPFGDIETELSTLLAQNGDELARARANLDAEVARVLATHGVQRT